MAAEGEDRPGNPTTAANATSVVQSRSACAECQRRKQKCNREWPCSHCQKRKVADKCRFTTAGTSIDKPHLQTSLNKKRAREVEAYNVQSDAAIDTSDDEDDDSLGFEAIGYMVGPLLTSFNDLQVARQGLRHKPPVETLDWATPDTCAPLKTLYDLLPTRENMDAIIQCFFETVNLHYYIIYPSHFLDQYTDWWARRARNQPVTLQWTCLLVMICACTVQHLDDDTRAKFDISLGQSTEKLTQQYVQAAEVLASLIPIGHYHIVNIQRILHSIYWYKAEAKFSEAWIVLSSAIREAQELGFNQERVCESLSDFDVEMRRRVWCILEAWDWQFASGLDRPTIIDRSDVDISLPNLSLEVNQISPCLYMKIQAEAVHQLADRFGAPKNVETVADLKEYHSILEAWIDGFPAIFSMDRPDTSKDLEYPWLVTHRYYLHTMANLMLLNPVRAHMHQELSKESPESLLEIRRESVRYSLRNLTCTSQWVSHVSHKDGRFHFIIFSLLDTAVLLCSILVKDSDLSVPRRNEIMCAIDNALSLLAQLRARSRTAKASHVILSRIIRAISYLFVLGDLPSFKRPRTSSRGEPATQLANPSCSFGYHAAANRPTEAPLPVATAPASSMLALGTTREGLAQRTATAVPNLGTSPDSGCDASSAQATAEPGLKSESSPPSDFISSSAWTVSPHGLRVPSNDLRRSPSDCFSLAESSTASPNNRASDGVVSAPPSPLANFVGMEPYATSSCAPPWPVEELPYTFIPGQPLLGPNGQPVPIVPFDDGFDLEKLMNPGELATAFMAEFIAS